MKTILWAEIMANGFYPVNPTSFETPDEVWAHFYGDIAAVGNVILGRKTVEEVLAAGNGFGIGDALMVAVSSQDIAFPGAVHAGSPQAALDKVAAAGLQTALVGGGVGLLNAFLMEDLVDELILLVVPAVGGSSPILTLGGSNHRLMHLLSSKEIGAGIVKLHYAIERAAIDRSRLRSRDAQLEPIDGLQHGLDLGVIDGNAGGADVGALDQPGALHDALAGVQ